MNILKRLGAFFLDILEVVVFAVSFFLFIYLLVFQPHKIKGDSMHPNFPNAEYLLTDKVTYRFQEPRRGDVIVFEAPPDNSEEYIKRIIGLPGETITIFQGKVYINDKLLEENYIDSTVYTNDGSFANNGEKIDISENLFFVMGDNRNYSSDSRSWGLVPKEKITGRAWLIYWPPSQSGKIKSPNYNL